MPEPTPTVIDLAIARKWYRCVTPAKGIVPGCPSHDDNAESRRLHEGAVYKMAAEIAAAELVAELQGLREIATSGPSTAAGRSPLSHRKVLDAQDHLDIMRGGGDADYDEAVAGLVDLVGAAIRDHEDRAGECPITAPSDPDEPCLYDRLRVALERVKR